MFDIFFEKDEQSNMDGINESTKMDESAIKAVQIIKKSSGDKFFYNYSWKKKTTAYYTCMSGDCKGRAKAQIQMEGDKLKIQGDLIVLKANFFLKFLK